MKLDTVCNQVYVVAMNEAKLQGHEYVTPEHYLYAALMFDLGKEMIMHSGGDVEAIQNDLLQFFETGIPHVSHQNPVESFGFIQLFESATNQAVNSERQFVTLGDLLVSVFHLQDSYAAYILIKNNVDKLSLLRYIAHEMPSRKATGVSAEERKKGKTILDTYTTDLTQKAKQGLFDPLVGRDDILDRTIQVLCRRLKNNPIHVGDPGVGKTSIVEGLATRIAQGNVPETIKNATIFYVDMATVVAGTKYRGDFEERLIKLMDAISKTDTPIVYLDEIHTAIGTGAVSSGGVDAIGILKPYMSKGEVRFIGSTTYEEYKKYFEKDRALVRRFQRIDVPEPTIEECMEILGGLKEKYEKYHQVQYTREIIQLICQLTTKYMLDKFLPDKAIDVMDEVGAYAKMQNKAATGKTYTITSENVEQTVALMAKVPEESVVGSEVDRLKYLEKNILKEVFGQEQAVTTVVDAVKMSRSGLKEQDKPVASLLFVGPTGVGKTEIAKQVAKHLNIKLQRMDMSEYQEKHAVARLIGSPPGYVGYEEGGLLTETIKKTPHCVLLLDEIEKAHSDILNVLLQIMDYGTLTDNVGQSADFRNVILIMTSNAGAKEMGKRMIGFDRGPSDDTAIGKAVERIFSPEFRNRLDAIVTFHSINKDMAQKIAKKAIGQLSDMLVKKDVHLSVTNKAIDYIAEKGFSEAYGAREILRSVDMEIKKVLVDDMLFGKLANGGKVKVGCVKGKLQVDIL